MFNKLATFSLAALALASVSCNTGSTAKETNTDSSMVRLITLDPGHFHAALVQKTMYPGIDSVVHVYAPDGEELNAHLALVKQYNERADKPTHWQEEIYKGNDFLDKMVADKKGNVVVIAGNNLRKTEYIKKSVDAGLNVLADKPMAITSAGFDLLLQSFEEANKKNVLLYDIMTERSEITTILQRELMKQQDVFGTLQQGTKDNPAVVMESVHHFYKYVSGNALKRPTWFFDPEQQGDAMADVGTHLVDLVQWESFPDKIIDYKKDIVIESASRWATPLTRSQFAAMTRQDSFPSFLKKFVQKDSVLNIIANGDINYTINGVHAKISALWHYQAPEGSGDTHYSLFRGTKANLVIKQGKEEQFQPTLYVEPLANNADFEQKLQAAIQQVAANYHGIAIVKTAKGWRVNIPDSFKVGHEAHFGQVMERFLQYLKNKKLPDWEQPNMIAKYYTTTKALQMATTK